MILFELLTGERPFRAERDTKLLMQQILNADPSQLNSQVPADLDTLCLKCLEKDPSRRFPTAAALAQELHRFLHGEPIHSRPITQWERARKWCQRNPAVAALSAVVSAVQISGGDSRREESRAERRHLATQFSQGTSGRASKSRSVVRTVAFNLRAITATSTSTSDSTRPLRAKEF